ncbi:MAG: hypothetical protein ABI533_01395 [Betaproteobacteria bacterium]
MTNYRLATPQSAEQYFNNSPFGQLYTLVAESLGRAASADPVRSPKRANGAGKLPTNGVAAPSLLDRVDDWFWRLGQARREAYLATSTDIFELERRIAALERGPIARYY